MSVKIRLQRFGKRNQAFYHIVAADARAPRDGKFIEKLGIYNPRTSPATIEIDTEKALKWLANGAQASDTCRAILAYRGVMYRKHLNEGVSKKAISQEEADNRYNAWLEEKNLKISQKSQEILNKKKESQKARLTEEAKAREKVAEKITAKRLAASEAIEADARKAAAEAAGKAEADAPVDEAPVDTADESEVAAPEVPGSPEPAEPREAAPEPGSQETGDTGEKSE